MSILVRFMPNAMTSEQYEQVKGALEAQGDFPPEGMEYHVCWGPEGQRKVSEIWTSREQLEAFTPRLRQVTGDLFEGGPDPEIHEVYNTLHP